MSRLLAKNLRTRLTVFYSALLAGALLLYAVCVSAFFLHNLREQLDASLDRDVETAEGDLVMTSDGRVDLTSHEGEADEDEFEGGYLLEVLGADGSVLYRSNQLMASVEDRAVGANHLQEIPALQFIFIRFPFVRSQITPPVGDNDQFALDSLHIPV